MPRPVRALFVSSCVRGGGAGWSLYYLLKHLDRSLVEPLVVVPAFGIFRQRFEALGVDVTVAQDLPERSAAQRMNRDTSLTRTASYALNLVDQVRFIPELADIVRRRQADVVYCNNMMVKPLGAAAAQLAGVPCILHVRNLHEAPEKILLYCKTTARLPVVKHVIANSTASAVPYRNAVGDARSAGKVHVVHNGIDFDEYAAESIPKGEFRRAHDIGNDEVLIGYTGNLIERKGLIPLIDAAARVLEDASASVRFVAVGRVPRGAPTAYRDACQRRIERHGIGSRFELVGFTDDVRPAVKDFDVLCLPSLQEPFGRSIIEAMALGTAVVATRVGGIPEIVSHDENGLLVPPGDSDALASALSRLVEAAPLRTRLASAALKTVHDHFDVAKLTQKISSLIVDAADVDPRPRVAIWRDSFAPYSETFIWNEARFHQRYRATVFARERLNADRFPFDDVVTIRDTSARGEVEHALYNFTDLSPRLARRLRGGGYRLIHAHFGQAAVRALPYAAMCGIPLVASFHGGDLSVLFGPRSREAQNLPYRAFGKTLLNHATLVLAASEDLREQLELVGCPPEKLRLFRLGIDLTPFSRQRREEDATHIVMVGRLVEKKGFGFALAAIARQLDPKRPLRVSIAGDGPLRGELETAARDLGIGAYCTFTGALRPEHVAALLGDADLLMAPSVVTPLGDRDSGIIVIKEAAACELPCLGTWHGGIPEIVEDGKTGFLVPEGDIDALSDRLGRLLHSDELRRRLGRAALEKVRREYDIRTQMLSLEKLYDHVLSGTL